MAAKVGLRRAFGGGAVSREAAIAGLARRADVAALAFSVTLAILVVGPPLLPGAFPGYELLRVGEVLDLLTPLLLVPLAWWLYRAAALEPPRTRETVAFLVVMALLIEGQALHLAANAIDHYVTDDAGDLPRLTHALDETLSHVIWHAALVALSVLVVLRSRAEGMTGSLAMPLIAATVYGVTFFLMVVEGGTGLIGLPAAVTVGPAGAWLGGRRLLGRPAASVFVVGYLVALALFATWAAMNGWSLPQFSEKGII